MNSLCHIAEFHLFLLANSAKRFFSGGKLLVLLMIRIGVCRYMQYSSSIRVHKCDVVHCVNAIVYDTADILDGVSRYLTSM